MKQPKYDAPLCKHLANDGWLKVPNHKSLQSIYLAGYLPDHDPAWRGHEWTRGLAYDRSREELGKVINPQEMH